MPSFPSVSPETGWPWPASWELTTPVPSVRVLDIDDHILGRPDKPDVLHLFTGVSTLRRFHAPGEHERLYPLPPTSATTVVDYVPHSVLTPDFHLPGARRHIVHVAVSVGDEGGPPTCIYNSALDQPLVDHLVIVLWPDWEGPDHDLTAGALARVLIFVANLMFPKVGHLTVVGLEPSACAQSTAPLNSIPRTWSERFKFMLTPYISMNKVEATYLTMTEWLNELDEDERDIIAVWPSRSDDIVSFTELTGCELTPVQFPTWRAAA